MIRRFGGLIAALTALVVVCFGAPAAAVAAAATPDRSELTYTYDAPAMLSAPDTVTSTVRASPPGPGAVSWGSSVVVRGCGVAANTGRAESIVAVSRTYVDLTKGGSIRNVGTNATHTEFAETLTQNGWASRLGLPEVWLRSEP